MLKVPLSPPDLNHNLITINGSAQILVLLTCVESSVLAQPSDEEPEVQNTHLATLLALVTATAPREEINNYLNKIDVIDTFLPHLEVKKYMG